MTGAVAEGAGRGTSKTKQLRLATALAWLRACRIRQEAVAGLGSDIAWELLLKIYAHQGTGLDLAISALPGFAANSDAVIARWVGALAARGMIERECDSDDGRTIYLSLTDGGIRSVELALDRVIASDRRLGLGRMSLND